MSYTISIDTDLKRNPYKGLYIALEGIDGSGKTTQVEKLKKFFEDSERNVVLTREPRKSGLIADINARVLEGEISLPQEAFQYLFTVDRVLNHQDIVLPALKRGDVVITDRCFWSAIAYGVWDMGKENLEDTAKRIMIAQGILAMQIQFTAPDITFYMSLSPTRAMKRLEKVDKKKEIYESKEIITAVQDTYQWLLQEFPTEFDIVHAEKSIDEVTADMIKIVQTFLHNKK